MRPPKRANVDYERIQKYDEWITGVIANVELREDHDTGYKYPAEKEDGTPHPKAGEHVICDQVRFKFTLEGHQYPHYSRWMRFSYGERSNLFAKYLKFLVEKAHPDMELDMDELKNFKVKTMWIQNGDWDNLEQIRPSEGKLKTSGNAPSAGDQEPPEEAAGTAIEDIPF